MTREDAIEIIRKNMPSDKSLPVYEAIQTLIPELSESEDERARKFLVKHVSEWIGCIEHDLKLSSKDVESEEELAMFKACLAYLERLKEYKLTEEDKKIIPEALVMLCDDIINHRVHTPIKTDEEGARKIKAFLKTFNRQPYKTREEWEKQKEPQHAIRVTKGFGDPDGPQFELVDIQEEQKPWSEEDEKNLKSVVSTLWFALNTPHFPLNYERIIELETWLESLKNRGNSPKSNTNSLWKPSEEQMEWLESAVKLSTDKPHIHGIIISLYEQLKRL